MLLKRWPFSRRDRLKVKHIQIDINCIDIDFDDDGFASCEEDEEVVKSRSLRSTPSKSSDQISDENKNEEAKQINVKAFATGDIMHDYYLDLDSITDQEELKYINIGREAVQHLLKELP